MAKMNKYRYTGPTSGVTLNVDGIPQEIMLHTGSEIELPSDNEYVKTLIALRYLVQLAQVQTKTTKGNN